MNLHNRLKTDLKAAMKARDKLRVQTIRGLIGTIDNAGAVQAESERYEPKVGLGHDVDRLEITDESAREMLVSEREDLLQAAAEFRQHDAADRATELETRAEIVAEYVR